MTALRQPIWLWDVLGVAPAGDGARFEAGGVSFEMRDGIPRARDVASQSQAETRDAFAFIWSGTERFAENDKLDVFRDWYRENFGDVAGAAWWADHGTLPLVVEAGCGAGISGSMTFGQRLRDMRYLGVDISSAVDAAAARFAGQGLPGAFLQANLMRLPLAPGSVDVIFSQGVLHHTDSTREAIETLSHLLKPGGRFLFYVYRRKGPVREFTDDYVRDRPGHGTTGTVGPDHGPDQTGRSARQTGRHGRCARGCRAAGHPGWPDRHPAPVLLARRQGLLPA